MTGTRLALPSASLFLVLLLIGSGCVGSGEVAVDQPITVEQNLWRGPDASLAAVLGDPQRSGEGWPTAIDASVLVHDIDGDGEPEFVVPSKDRLTRVFAADGTVLAELPMRLPPSWHVDNIMNAAVAATLEAGGPTSIVVSTPAGGMQAWRFDGRSDAGFDFTMQWDVRLDGCHPSPGMDATPVAVDVDGDGADELFSQVEQGGMFGVDDDGSPMWQVCWGGGNAGPAADDLDGDGDTEVVFAGDNGLLVVIDGASGDVQWTFDARAEEYGIFPASIPVAPTIAELDGQAPKEVLFTARQAPNGDPENYGGFHMAIFAVHQDLTDWQAALLWIRQPEWAHPMSYTRLQVDDVDGDGMMDIFGMDWNTIGHHPGAWEQLGDAHVFRLDAQGNDVWVRDIEAWWSNKDIALADADWDDEMEVLVVAPHGAVHGIWRLDAADGDSEGFLSAGGMKVARGPVMTAVDGRLHIAAPVVSEEAPVHAGVVLFDLGVPA